MDSFEFTKIAGAVLSALLLIFGTKTIIESRSGHAPAKPGFTLPSAAAPAAPAAEKAAEAPKDGAAPAPAAAPGGDKAAPAGKAEGGDTVAATIAALGKANVENGKGLFKKCATCHTIEKGKPKGVGPNLWGVVNRPKASFEGFEYSPDMKAKGGNWTFEDLAQFIHNPKGFVTGTKMVFSGFPNPADAADVIAYLAGQADTPAALPK